MRIGIPKETDDQRVALVPALIKKLKDLSVDVMMEKDAGLSAGFANSDYLDVNFENRDEVIEKADIIVTVNPLSHDEMKGIKGDKILISLFEPYNDKDIVPFLEKQKIKAFSLDMIPRTTRAQSMDVLSSMASIAGYKAVLEATNYLPRYLPMMITAAGSIKPSTVLILGAGVAGLQAVATAKRLGAMVQAFDTRAAAKEEVESLGGKFIEVEGAADDTSAGGYAVEQSEDFLKRQREEVQKRAAKADIIITTAQVRGRKAPLLVPEETILKMKRGAVIVDLAASTGGNCAFTKDREVVTTDNGVAIIGDSALASKMPQDASTLFGNNVFNFLKLLVKDGNLNLDMEDDILEASMISGKPVLQDQK